MLRNLRIRNFALIEEVELQFNGGYTVITGETGSGKSILLNALGLILGDRADFTVIGNHGEKAIVEAEFDLTKFDSSDFFSEHELDHEPTTLIRREVTKQGKSRAFINDTPVQLTVLKALTSQLLNIHSQYNTIELKEKEFQLNVLDILSDLNAEKQDYLTTYKTLRQKERELDQLRDSIERINSERDYNAFQLNELNELQPDTTDFERYENELKRSSNVTQLREVLGLIITTVSGDDQVADRLRMLRNRLEKVGVSDPEIDLLTQRIQTALIELEDISGEAERMVQLTEIDPQELERMSHIIDKYNSVLRKHRLSNREEMIALRDQLEKVVLGGEELEKEIEMLSATVKELTDLAVHKAKALHEKRVKSSSNISQLLQNILKDLKLPDTRLEFDLNTSASLRESGFTTIEMRFSANAGMEPVPIEKAASGGELSRVMLALQQLISEHTLLPTVLFDEIDTGVSGEVAQKIGMLLKKMGTQFQLLAISHLPQVAAKADYHFIVEKSSDGKRTETSVRALNGSERVDEIARLMSGELITDSARENALALMN
ncbi:MAG: repair protein RecN [Bacteroidota bacterium]